MTAEVIKGDGPERRPPAIYSIDAVVRLIRAASGGAGFAVALLGAALVIISLLKGGKLVDIDSSYLDYVAVIGAVFGACVRLWTSHGQAKS